MERWRRRCVSAALRTLTISQIGHYINDAKYRLASRKAVLEERVFAFNGNRKVVSMLKRSSKGIARCDPFNELTRPQ